MTDRGPGCKAVAFGDGHGRAQHGTVRLQTSRLTLRRAGPGDLAAIHRLLSNPAAMRYWSTPEHETVAQSRDWLAAMLSTCPAAADTERSDTALGDIGARDAADGYRVSGDDPASDDAASDDPASDDAVSDDGASDDAASDDFLIEHQGQVVGKAGAWRLPEVGFLLDPALWGRGLAREAMTAAITHLFATHAIPALTAETDPRNTASLSLLARLGFRETHRALRTMQWRDEWCDSIYLRLDRTDWPAA